MHEDPDEDELEISDDLNTVVDESRSTVAKNDEGKLFYRPILGIYDLSSRETSNDQRGVSKTSLASSTAADSTERSWNMEPVGNPASGSLNGSLNGAYYIASSMPHITKQASTTHNFQPKNPRDNDCKDNDAFEETLISRASQSNSSESCSPKIGKHDRHDPHTLWRHF